MGLAAFNRMGALSRRKDDPAHASRPFDKDRDGFVMGEGAVRCMQLALEDAGLTTADIGHVNAHGTSTPLNDASEAEAVLKVFGGTPPPITSVKGATGHLIGAAGAVEAIASILAMEHGLLWPTANHKVLDPALGPIDVVSGAPRPLAAAPALSNSFGFGGHNASLVLTPGP